MAYMQTNKTEVDSRILDEFSTEDLSKSGEHLFKRRRVYQRNQQLGTEYLNSIVFDARFFKEMVIHVVNTDGADGLTFKVQGCIDPNHWVDLDEAGVTEFAVLAGAEKVLQLSVAWAFIRLQAKNTVAGNITTIDAYIAGKA